jgi:hypothetical protein
VSPVARRLLSLRGTTAELNAQRLAATKGLDAAQLGLLRDELGAIEAHACTVASMATDLQERCRSALTAIPAEPAYNLQLIALANGGVQALIADLNAEIENGIELLTAPATDASDW